MKKNKWLATAALIIGVFVGFGTAQAAERDMTAAEYISDIKIVSGSDAAESMTEDGWKVMPDRIDGSMIAYQTDNSKGNALRDIRLVKSGADVGDIEGASYQKFGNIGGYTLCGTTDNRAGGEIVGVYMADEPIAGDGSHTVRNENGEAVELSDGLYLTTIHAGNTGAYLSGVALVKAGSEKAARRKAANQGYDYFRLIWDDDDRVELVAFNRTNDKDEAVRGIYAVGEPDKYKLYYSTSPAAGLPITDIELSEVSEVMWEGASFTLGDWAKRSFSFGAFSKASSYILQDDTYRELTNRTDKYRWNPVLLCENKESLGQALTDGDWGGMSEPGIVIAQEDKAFESEGEILLDGVDMTTFFTETEDEEDPAEEVEEEDPDEPIDDTGESEFGASENPTDIAVDDPDEVLAEGDGASFENEENIPDGSAGEEMNSEGDTSESNPDEETATGSLISSGSVILIILGAVLIIAIVVFGLFYRKRKNGGAQ